VIRPRFDEALSQRLLASEWWMYGPSHVIDLPVDKPERFVSMVEEHSTGWKRRPWPTRRWKNICEAGPSQKL